jgi:hypothetical protein
MIAVRSSHLVIAVAGLAAGIACYTATRPAPPANREVPVVTAPKPGPVPEYLKTPELWVRAGNDIVRAPAEDNAVAATYATSPARSRPLVDNMRIAILTARTRVAVGEPVRVIHVLDAPEPGTEVYVMGPKEITDEVVDGVPGTAQPVIPLTYDGMVVRSPHADFNYDITVHTFTTPGRHTITWHLGNLTSNTLEIDVH